jgi:hypothetical protein
VSLEIVDHSAFAGSLENLFNKLDMLWMNLVFILSLFIRENKISTQLDRFGPQPGGGSRP